MTFEEFFKKKRIDLDAFQLGNPGLLSEFKTHFEQMGEKSFDHTKKYWFNKLRGEYHLAAEVKTEKPKIENQLAEQTVTDSINEAAEAPAPKTGFTPRYKAAAVPSPPSTEAKAEELRADETPAPAAPKPGFTPRFKAGATKPVEAPAEEKSEETPAATPPKTGFTPRFKAGVTKPSETTPGENKSEVAPETEKPKVGFTPRFKAGVTKPVETASEVKAEETVTETPSAPEATEKPKGFTPRFKAGVTKPAEAVIEEKKEEPVIQTPSAAEPLVEKPKVGFTPRFKAGVTKAEETSSGEKKEEPLAETPVVKAQNTLSDDSSLEENKAEPIEAAKPKVGFTPRFKAGVTKQKPPTKPE